MEEKRLSHRIASLAESATIAMATRSRELRAEGKDIIGLSMGEPDFNTPDFIKEAAKKAIDENFSKYPPVPGYESLREAICAKFLRDNGLHYEPNQIVVSTGAKQSIMNVALALVNPGDEDVLPSPYWVSYHAMAHMSEGKVVEIPCGIEQDFKLTPDQLDAHLNDQSRLMIFSSPCNPSGSLYSRTELEALAQVILKYPNLIVVSDEIYEHINFVGEHASLASIDGMMDRVVTVNGVSKAFAMTGWRIGYIGAPLWIAKACTKTQGQFTSAASGISQKAAEAAVLADPKVIDTMREAFLKRRDMLIELLGEIPEFKLNKPGGAFYLFPEIDELFGKSKNGKTIEDANDLCMYLLNEAGVALVSGEAFGNPKCLRISYAASDEDLREAARRIKEALLGFE